MCSISLAAGTINDGDHLSSSIIQHIERGPASSDDNSLAYFYFNFRDPVYRDSNALLRSVLHQLLSHSRASDMLAQLAERYAHVASLASLDVELLITETAKAFKQTFMVVDGLDECSDPSAVLPALVRLGSKIRLLVMSRDHEDIRRAFRGCTVFQIASQDLDQDIHRYVIAEVQLRIKDGRLRIGGEGIIDEVMRALVSGAQGM